MSKLRIGVDMGESRFSACLINAKGTGEAKWQVPSRPVDRKAWLDEVSALGTICLVLETTESFSERLATEARERGLEVYVVSSGALHNFRRSEGFEDKRDDLDAYLLGLMGHRGIRSVKLAVVRTDEEERLRSLDRARTRLVRHRVSIGQQLRAVILRLSPEIFAEGWRGPKVVSATFQAVLARWPKLTPLGRTRLGTVVTLVKRIGRYPQGRAEEIARSLRQWALDLQRIPQLRIEGAEVEIEVLRENLELLDRQIRGLERQIKEAVLAHPRGPSLLEMHGTNTVVAARLLAESAPRARVMSEPELATHSGLTPASRSSGKSEKSRLRRSVSKPLANIHFISAVASLQSSSIDRAYYDKKRKDFQGHPAAHPKATIALARQRHKVIYKILLGECYDEIRLAKSTLERARKAA